MMSENKRSFRGVGAVAVLIVLSMLTTVLFTGCGDDEEPSETSVTTTVADTAKAPEATEETTVTTTAATEAPTAATEAPETDAPATEAAGTNGTTAATTSPLANYNPPADRNTDFTGCLFIGDSRTQGLMLYSGVYGAGNYTARGLNVDSYFSTAAVDLGGGQITIAQAVETGPDYERVYISLGINELGWAYTEVFAERYGKLIDHVKTNMPNAKIIVQSIIPITAARSASDEVFNNTNVTRFNAAIKDMCKAHGVTYLDLTAHMGDETGALPEGAAFDGIHLNKPYCQKWLDFLKKNM